MAFNLIVKDVVFDVDNNLVVGWKSRFGGLGFSCSHDLVAYEDYLESLSLYLSSMSTVDISQGTGVQFILMPNA